MRNEVMMRMPIIYQVLIITIYSSLCYTKIHNPHPFNSNYVFFPNEDFNIIPEDHELSDVPSHYDQLNRTTLDELNKITDVVDFSKLFGVPVPYPPPTSLASTGIVIGGRSGAGTSKSSSAEEATQAGCQPDLVPVKLSLKKQPNTIYYPTCVRLPRCAGCCYGTMLSCQPTKEEKVKLQILKVKTSTQKFGNRRMIRYRRHPRSVNKYDIVEETKHVECSCQCKVKEKHCDLNVHKYVQSECLCKCKDRKQEEHCHYKSHTHIWDRELCRCLCKVEHECSTGEYFNHKTCGCMSKDTKPSSQNTF